MYPFFNNPATRFVAGFIGAVFLSMPVVWLLSGRVGISAVAALVVAVIGTAAGMFWVRRPPEIFFRLPADAHGPGLSGNPAVRFAAAFVFSIVVYLAAMSILPDPLSDFSLAPMIGLGLVCGLMAARKSAAIFTSRSTFPR